MFETLIVNGKVIDGAGRAWFRAAVGIEGDTVTVLEGDVSNVEAGRTIDASGMAVCPGFIDMHSHSDFALLTSPRHEPKVSQGVTTEALGQDGLSYAPISPANRQHLVDYLTTVNGRPPEGYGVDVGGVVPRSVRGDVVMQRGLLRAACRAPYRGDGMGEPPADRC